MGFIGRIFGGSDSSRNRNAADALWHPDQYRGESAVAVTATQLDHKVASPGERRRIYAAWIDFFSSPTPITVLDLRSRVPQELLDSLRGQPQLEALHLKWGPYRDIGVVGQLPALATLALGGATALESVEAIRGRDGLIALTVEQAHRVTDPSPISTLRNLRDLAYGGYVGSDKPVVLENVRWIEPLKELRSLDLPGTRLLDADVSPLLELSSLEELNLPLRRTYRAQVFEFAATSRAFAGLAAKYTAYDEWSSEMRRESS
ncbi:hypothetical protein B1729_10010 [Microbacterium sp. B35-04]|uniref:hypothetical protein n=1 Tax=unclassified Microbacterium TaxID=2609290 RepID=UPI0013D102D1|nr:MULTISPECIES: hypothetical protein [unclassified Microbacterium]KAF2413379.1 hypothetical protein B1729_10010 [Microbacterium sp. B35-04]KAF2419456.1 hypothetical protein B2K11_06775 [Microbacterium sp. B35-30]